MTLTGTLHMHSRLEQSHSCQPLLVPRCVGTQLLLCAVSSSHPSWKKHHSWHVFDTVHLFCLRTMHFKEGQDARVAKCVPNKWYPSQNGTSLEGVLAKGSKSMGLCQHPSILCAGTHSWENNGPSWLCSSKGLWPRARKLLREFNSTSWDTKWGKMETKQGTNYNKACKKETGREERWGYKRVTKFTTQMERWGVISSLWKTKALPTVYLCLAYSWEKNIREILFLCEWTGCVSLVTENNETRWTHSCSSLVAYILLLSYLPALNIN